MADIPLAVTTLKCRQAFSSFKQLRDCRTPTFSCPEQCPNYLVYLCISAVKNWRVQPLPVLLKPRDFRDVWGLLV